LTFTDPEYVRSHPVAVLLVLVLALFVAKQSLTKKFNAPSYQIGSGLNLVILFFKQICIESTDDSELDQILLHTFKLTAGPWMTSARCSLLQQRPPSACDVIYALQFWIHSKFMLVDLMLHFRSDVFENNLTVTISIGRQFACANRMRR